MHLANVNWTILDINAIINVFPFLENLTVENSNISSIIPPNRTNEIKVRKYSVVPENRRTLKFQQIFVYSTIQYYYTISSRSFTARGKPEIMC